MGDDDHIVTELIVNGIAQTCFSESVDSFFEGTPSFNTETKGFSVIQTQERAWAEL